jgi:hypothetical protein
MVYAAERLVFEGPPELDPPLVQDHAARRCKVREGAPLNTRTAIPSLNPIEVERVKQLKAAAAQALAGECRRTRTRFITEQVKHLIDQGVMPEAAKAAVENMTGGVLLPSVDLAFDDPALAGKTVGDILADPEAFIGETLADPLEGVDYGRCKAKLLRRSDGLLVVHSFAHGRAIYYLRHDPDSLRDALAKVPDGEAVRAFVRLCRMAELGDVGASQIRRELISRLKLKASEFKEREKIAIEAERAAERQRLSEERERQRQAKGDTRPRIRVPAKNAPQTEVIELLDAVLSNSTNVEPPMRDGMGYLVAAFTRSPLGLHALGSAAEAPKQELLVRLDEHEALAVIEQHIDFIDRLGHSVRLPSLFVKEYHRQRLGSPLPMVGSIATMPIVLADGEILSGHRLDRERGVLFRVPGSLDEAIPVISECTPSAIAEAVAFLVNEWLVDVMAGYASRLKLIAKACTVIERHLLKVRPGFLITSSQRGDGKTTAINMLSVGTLGVEAPGATWANDEDERRKALLAYLSQGVAMLPYDNLKLGAVIDCPHVARVLTKGTYEDRVLGVTETREVDTSTVISWTGNNAACRGDLNSRVLRVPFTSTRVDPENRPLIHADPISWSFANRLRILRALYTIILGNPRLAGASTGEPPTRFKDWWNVVGLAVEWASHCHLDRADLWREECKPCVVSFAKEFADNEEDNEQTAALAIVLTMLRSKWPGTFTAKDVITYSTEHPGYDPEASSFASEFFPALDTATDRPPLQHWTSLQLSLRLKKLLGTPIMLDGRTMALRFYRDVHGGTWQVAEVAP